MIQHTGLSAIMNPETEDFLYRRASFPVGFSEACKV
jgi:hypothetical protein